MPTERLGEQRSNGLYRLLFAVVLALGGIAILGVLFVVAFVAAVLWMIWDVLMQLLFDRDASMSGTVPTWLKRLYSWPLAMLRWLFWGDGTFPWTPPR